MCNYSLFVISRRSDKKTNQSRCVILQEIKLGVGMVDFRVLIAHLLNPVTASKYAYELILMLCHPLLRWLHIRVTTKSSMSCGIFAQNIL